jgi:RNA polymerase sigma-70 factor (ECF subfamily)
LDDLSQHPAILRLKSDPWYDGEEAGLLLQEAILSLPERQRQVFQLRYHDEMSYKDMSEILETSEGALKASFHHAVKKIQEYVRTRQKDI